MKILLPILVLIFSGSVFAQAQTKCFRNDGLKDNHIVRFEADGGDVAGSYFVETDGDAEQTQTFDFSGTRSGNSFDRKICGRRADWRCAVENEKFDLDARANRRTAKFCESSFTAKTTKQTKTPNYSADFVSCEPDFATLAKQGETHFVCQRRKIRQPFRFRFKTQSERKAFWLGARKGQTVSVMSPGCGISVYYPDKTADQEGGIDTFSLENITQSGDYLFVISPAGEPGNCATTFKINN